MSDSLHTKKPSIRVGPLFAVATVAFLLAAFSTSANETSQRGRRPGQSQLDPRQQATRRFEATAPAIGEPLPDLVVYDASGHERALDELLHGHYTILVLGCLT